MEALSNINVKDCMARDVVVIGQEETVAAAYQIMSSRQIRHLPVVDRSGKVVGIFSDRDLNRAYPPRETDSGWYYPKEELQLLSLRHFMTADPTTIGPEAPLKDAVRIFVRDKIGLIPVTGPDGRPVGVISYIDVLKKIASLL